MLETRLEVGLIDILTNLCVTPTSPLWPKWFGMVTNLWMAQFWATSPCFASKATRCLMFSQCSFAQSLSLASPTSIKSLKACHLFFK
jgi:hypothetical protein